MRQVNTVGAESYDRLMTSGLYAKLTEAGLMVKHVETDIKAGGHKVLRPEIVPFVSYPYEWSFSQLKDAALATLEIQKLAMKQGMSLRDASAYNIQFAAGKPVMIDTLSFDVYDPSKPWIAYRQFCQHFLAPLALMAYRDPDLLQLLRVYLDGVPLPLAVKLLPVKAKLQPGLAIHLSLHAGFQKRHEDAGPAKARAVSQTATAGLIDSLKRAVTGLTLSSRDTQWSDYYDNTNYDSQAFKAKEQLVIEQVKRLKPDRVIDLGGNNGQFSRPLLPHCQSVVCADIDPLAVEDNYRQVKQNGETNLLPLLIDLTNPSAPIGWANAERQSFTQRAKSDLAVALALIHHLAITNNLPLPMIAEYFAQLARHLIIEFVPKEDSQVQRLLATREDIFDDYTGEGFEQAFGGFYDIVDKQAIIGSKRSLYQMRRK